MKIKMKNEEMTQCVDLMQALKEKGKLGYAIMRNQRRLGEASTEYRKIKNNAISKYGKERKQADGTEYMEVPKELIPEFLKEIEEIGMIEEEVDIYRVTAEEFYSGSLTSDQMMKLCWMVEPEAEGE